MSVKAAQTAKEQQWRKQKAILQQNIQFLEQQLQQYRQREADNKKLNQSIMITYQQSENIREEHIARSMKIMTDKHEEEVARLRDNHHRECKMLQDTVNEYKGKYQQLIIEGDRRHVEFQRRLLDLKRKYEQELKKEVEEKQAEYQAKIQVLNEKLKQAESMANVYTEMVQNRRGIYQQDQQYLKPGPASLQMRRSCSSKQNFRTVEVREHTNNESFHRQSRKQRIRDIHENNIKDLRRLSASRESVRHLTAKIEKAVTQLKGSTNHKLHERISEKLAKRIY